MIDGRATRLSPRGRNLGTPGKTRTAAIKDDYDAKNAGGSLRRVAGHHRRPGPRPARARCSRARLWTKHQPAEVPGGPPPAHAPEQLDPRPSLVGPGRSTRSRAGP